CRDDCTHSSLLLFSSRPATARARHSFPTRRSSDLDDKNQDDSDFEVDEYLNEFAEEDPTMYNNHPDPGGEEDDYRKPIEVVNSRSEEHTSELQSREKLVCRLLLEQKNNIR